MRFPFLIFSSFFFFAALGYAAPTPILLGEVGSFGGIRLKAPCKFGKASFDCTIDTMGSVSVAAEGPAFSAYPVLGIQKITGIGFSITCQQLLVPDFSFLGKMLDGNDFGEGQGFSILQCPMQNSDFPLIGLPYFEGKKFTFDFPRSLFHWGTEEDAEPPLPLLRVGAQGRWIGFATELGGERALLSFDTGNPVTMVKQGFVDRHPELFRFSPREMNPSLKAKGLVPYEILAPIEVNGVALHAEYVYAISSLPFPDSNDLQVILGMNHMAKALWSFDLLKNEFRLSLPQ